MKKTRTRILGLCLPALLVSCSSTTEKGSVGVERRQLLLVSPEQVAEASKAAYDKTKNEAAGKKALDQNADQVRRVNEIMRRLIPGVGSFRRDAVSWPWEVHVITSPELNAFCLPNGKIMFYSGIIEKLKLTDGEIAAIMGHEIAHALREHGRERMSEEMVKQLGVNILISSGKVDPKYAGAMDAALAVAISLPHSRGQESEADQVGLELMARAGYNPQDALSLWKKMGAVSQGKPPEFLSTHPSDQTRLKRIEALLPKVMPLYRPAAS
ncbi:MAG: M48 family metallopeptidase [Bdellovibrionaceae bacterium]|nr:M48 family metallopeptidase [Pseudobdellovibrionaceae bacterium]MBX3033867.1 M48 family metallopeptidase [Pseudobdellovibrionaceae bacterium]